MRKSKRSKSKDPGLAPQPGQPFFNKKIFYRSTELELFLVMRQLFWSCDSTTARATTAF
jgi:hypothetical protein